MRLNLRHTVTTTMSSSQYRDTLYVAYAARWHHGHGEGAPIVRYHEDAESARKAVESVRALLLSANPMQFAKVMAEVFRARAGRMGGQGGHRYRAHGLGGTEARHPALHLFRTRPKERRRPRFRSASTPRDHQTEDSRSRDFPILKVKVGLAHRRAHHRSVGSVTKKPLRVDATRAGRTRKRP